MCCSLVLLLLRVVLWYCCSSVLFSGTGVVFFLKLFSCVPVPGVCLSGNVKIICLDNLC